MGSDDFEPVKIVFSSGVCLDDESVTSSNVGDSSVDEPATIIY